ncbi:MAG: ATP-binding protein, partial [Sphingobacteriales bacterium]
GFSYTPPDPIYYSPAATFKVDSLRTLLGAALTSKDIPADTMSINRINRLASEFFNINPDSTLYYGKLAVEKSLVIKYDKGLADGLFQTAKALVRKGDYASAQKRLDKAKLLYSSLKDEKSISDCFLAFGWMYEIMADYKLASNYFKQALVIKKRIKDEPGIARCYNNMGMVADDTGKSSYALDDYFKSLSLNIKLHNKIDAASNYNNIGTVMQDLEIYPKAMEYYLRAIKIWQETRNAHGVSIAYQNIGEILLAQKNYNQAIVYLSKSIKLNKEQGDKESICSLYTDLGLCYANKKQFKTAFSYLDQALVIASRYNIDVDKANVGICFATVYNMQADYQRAYNYALPAKTLSDKLGSLSMRIPATLQLSNALGGLKRFEAYEVRKQYDDLKDSLKSDEIVQKLTSFNLESNFAGKQQRLAEQRQRMAERYRQNIQKHELVSALFFIIILGMGAILIVYYRAKLKQKKINAVLEDKNKEVQQQKTDIDEQAQKLKNSNILKDRLISVLAHDLRAPLSTLRGLFSLLEDESISQEQFLRMIPKALKKLEYTSDFLDTLLFWVNSQMENFDSSVKNFYIKDIVANKIQNYNEQAGNKGITLIDNVPASIAVLGDPNSVRIVIRNLVTNAIKFSKQNDTISISARQLDDNNILFSIKDTGVGMSETQLNKLFKSKVDSGTGTNNESGTGMGLLFCKDLIEKCNGKIWVQSEAGQGTEFFFTLPAGNFTEETVLVA